MLGLKLNHVSKRGPRTISMPLEWEKFQNYWFFFSKLYCNFWLQKPLPRPKPDIDVVIWLLTSCFGFLIFICIMPRVIIAWSKSAVAMFITAAFTWEWGWGSGCDFIRKVLLPPAAGSTIIHMRINVQRSKVLSSFQCEIMIMHCNYGIHQQR